MKNPEVTAFLNAKKSTFHETIEMLRELILSVDPELNENVKWTAPNYFTAAGDRFTMRLHPKRLQLILHRGAQKLAQPEHRIIRNDFGLLEWKENDRAVATFGGLQELRDCSTDLTRILKSWLQASK